MSTEKELNYETIENSYDSTMTRTSATSEDSSQIVGLESDSIGTGSDTSVKTGESFDNIWIKTWIKSDGYLTKRRGFLIDGENGYIECMKLYVGGGGIEGGSIDIPNSTSSDSFHVASNGDTYWGCTQAEWETSHSNSDAYILSTGDAVFNSVAIGGGTIEIGINSNSAFHCDENGNIWLGDGIYDVNTNPFSVSNIGYLKSNSGKIGGWTITETTIESDGGEIIIDSANQKIESSNYVSGAFGSGFHIDEDLLEVGNIACRGLIRTAVFQKDVISAIGGSFVVLDADVLDIDMTSSDNSTLTTKGDTTFAVNDILRIKDGVEDEWMQVTNIDSAPTYIVTRDKANSYSSGANPAWKKGATVVNYKQSGDGGIYMTASDSNAPYLSIFDHAGSPWATINTRLRIGNLNGYLGYSSDLYGIGIGETGNSMTYDPDNGLRLTGTVNATAGYFGNVTNGISIAANGLLINGSGYIRTAASANRIEIVRNTGGGLTDGILMYDSDGDICFRIANGGSPYLSMNLGGNDVGVAQFLSSHSTTTNTNLYLTTAGANIGINLVTSGSAAARDGKGSLDINNTAVYGNSIKIVHGTDATGDMFDLTPNIKNANIFKFNDNDLTATHEARITNEAYLQFPAYYHCSDFDEYLSSSTVLASTNIAKCYWTGGGTSGTQTITVGSTEDQNTYIALSTTSTASRSSTLTFGRYIDPSNQSCLEFRFRVNNITNTAFRLGFYTDATHYSYFSFDTDVSATNIYFKSYDGSSSSSSSTGIEMNNSTWHTFRMFIYASNGYALYIDDTKVTAGTQYTNIGHSKPYIYIDNKAASEEKILYLDYVKIWSGRDDSSAAS